MPISLNFSQSRVFVGLNSENIHLPVHFFRYAHRLEEMEEERDKGVFADHRKTTSHQCDAVIKKANAVVGMLCSLFLRD